MLVSLLQFSLKRKNWEAKQNLKFVITKTGKSWLSQDKKNEFGKFTIFYTDCKKKQQPML